MKYEVRYRFDGGLWYQVVEAESERQAVDALLYDDPAREILGVKLTGDQESADLIVPAGWQRPAPPAPLTEEMLELARLYEDFAWQRCRELDLDPEDCDIDYDTWLREVYHV